MESEDPLRLSEFSLVFGPRELVEPAFSFDVDEAEVHTPEEFAAAVLSAPGVRLAHDATPEWSNWKARWEEADRFIELDMLVCEIDPNYRPGTEMAWGGSGLRARCLLGDLLDLWAAIRTQCPGVWLHDTEGRLYSPASCAAEHGGRSRRCI